jgi:hypothetical protein
MSKTRIIYSNDLVGRRKAIANLQFALEDSKPWFLNVKYRPNNTAIVKHSFATWITKDTFDKACKAIFNALEPIYFYQFSDMEEMDKFD